MNAARGPRIAIIIPTRNEAGNIVATLTDLAPLRADGHALIVVDGGSTDTTCALARPLADQILICAPGRARQMNLGAACAQADLLWFVHADTRIPPQAIAALQTVATEGCTWGRFDIRLSGTRWPLRIVERMMNWRSRLTGIATGDQGIFVARTAFDAAGGFPTIALMEDIALTDLLRHRCRPHCVQVPLITSSRRWERHGVWRTVMLMWRLRLAYALGASPTRLARSYYP